MLALYRSSTLGFRLNFCIISQLFKQATGPASIILSDIITVILDYINVFQFYIVKPLCLGALLFYRQRDVPFFHPFFPLYRSAFMKGRRKNVKLRKRRNMLKVQDEMVWKIMRMDDRICRRKRSTRWDLFCFTLNRALLEAWEDIINIKTNNILLK
jgi:hypothetical protein